ncbi:MAG: 30S ribosomal protein S17 [Parachlamydiaceae bacterium]|nr:30S ribosomal protein S17 [Parachlamydiaceae bacterium]
MEERGNRKVRQGRVVSNKMEKTVVVVIEKTMRHPKYEKVIKRKQKLYAHHDGAPLEVGATVTVVETRPLSKLKRWRVVAE